MHSGTGVETSPQNKQMFGFVIQEDPSEHLLNPTQSSQKSAVT